MPNFSNFFKVREGLNDFLKNVDFFKKHNNYNIISIIGLQSSGKSTLLNQLFGTEFSVMNSTIGHSMTTRGIVVSKNND